MRAAHEADIVSLPGTDDNKAPTSDRYGPLPVSGVHIPFELRFGGSLKLFGNPYNRMATYGLGGRTGLLGPAPARPKERYLLLTGELGIVGGAAHAISATQLFAGHTDDIGPADGNQRLSQRRADAVRNWLVDNGIDADRLTAVGYGEDQPIADNSTEEGRTANRRIEFIPQTD